MKLRLTAFVVAIALMVCLVAWTAFTSARLAEEARARLSLADSESFAIADRLQEEVLDLNRRVFRFAVTRDTNEWAAFQSGWESMNQWIDQQHLLAPAEKEILTQINGTNDDYYLEAQHLHGRVLSGAEGSVLDYGKLQEQAARLLDLSFKLAEAHRQNLVSSVANSAATLEHFQLLLFGALSLIIVFGMWLARFVYKELIAPLQVKLVESQALLERHEKLASLGTLAAGVAHEIRNPLTAIKAWLFMHQRNLRSGTQEEADAKVIGNEIDRLERIVKDFLVFARPSDPELREVTAEEALQEVHQLFALQMDKAKIQFIREPAPPVRVKADPQQLKQVLINLIQNAGEAVGQNGTVTLGARTDRLALHGSEADVVLFEVTDTGKGIAPDVEKRLFDPFFSTKESGTGLGLSIAARIVEKHGGMLQYKTRVNYGTTFGIVLPCLPKEHEIENPAHRR
jgi:signal transduction histidine kinase